MRFRAETVEGIAAADSPSGACPMRNSMGTASSHISAPVNTSESKLPAVPVSTVRQQTIHLKKRLKAGSDMSHKKEGSVRIFSLNVNGFSVKDPVGSTLAAADRCFKHQIDFAGFSETNLDFANPKFRMNMRREFADKFSSCKMTTSSSRIVAPDIHKVGGTMSIAFPVLCGRTSSAYTDPSGLGRYNVVLIRGSGRRGLAIITAYAAAETGTGPNTFATQQRVILRTKGANPNQSLKDLLYADLRTELESVLKKGYIPILMGDFNESIYTENNGLRRLMRAANMIDPLAVFDTHSRDMATHSRGSKRIDYIFVSREIQHAVTAYGITELDQVVDSDHRGIFCDLDFELAFDTPLAPLLNPKGRGIQGKCTTQSIKFLSVFDKMMQGRNIHRRCEELLDAIKESGPTPSASRKMRGIDTDLRDALLCAERRSGRAYAPPWSRDLHLAFLECRFWNIYCRRDDDLANSADTLTELATEIGWPSLPVIPRKEAEKRRKAAQRKARSIRREAESHREKMLEEDLNEAEHRDEKSKAKALRAIAKCEATRRSYLKLRFANKGNVSGALAAVQQQQPDGSIATTTHPDEMVPLLLEAGRRHFSQAEGTPFTKLPLATMEYTGACLQADAILRGCSTFTSNNEISESTRDWISHAHHLDSTIDPIEISSWLTPEEVKKGYTKWKESTSTSPAGDHLSIYKILAKDLGHVSKDAIPKECRPLKTIQKEAWDCITTIMNLGCHFGLTIPRWEKAVCTMIEKAPGNFLLHKLRRIFIFASDYNLSLGIIVGRRLVWAAEDKDRIHQDLWGSRPGRSAPDAVTMKENTYEMARITGTPLATFDNDAKSCYDRIVMLVAAILARRLGLPKTTAEWLNKTLHFMQCQVKTALGVSDEHFGSTDGHDVPKHGPGQGHRAAPALWLVISSYLFERMDKLAHGVSFKCPEATLEHSRKLDGYVDDVSSFFNLFDRSIKGDMPLPAEMAKGMNKDASSWAEQLFISGGALELSKCFWYLLYPVVSTSNEISWASKEKLIDQGAKITLHCHQTDTAQLIEMKDPTEGHRTLGAHKTITGSQSLQFSILREKSETFGAAMSQIQMTRTEAMMAAECILLPKLAYPLNTGCLLEKECTKIHSPGLSECIRGMGFCKTAPRAMIHGPLDLGGASVTSLYAAQTWALLDSLQHHLRENREPAKLFRICIGWTQLVAGVGFKILSDCTNPLPHCRRSTIITLREGLGRCNASFDFFDSPFYTKLREGDMHLMDLAMTLFSAKNTLKDINACRLYVGAITVADIASADGRCIMRAAYTCSERGFRNTRLLWPRVPAPNKRQQARWRRFLVAALLKPYRNKSKGRADIRRIDLQLTNYLGRWIHPPTKRQCFKTIREGAAVWTYDVDSKQYHKDALSRDPSLLDPTWLPDEKSEIDRGKSRPAYLPLLNKYPPAPGNLRLRPVIMSCDRPKLHIAEYLDAWKRPFLENLTHKRHDDITIWNANTLLMVSDGGAEDGLGSFGTVIATESGAHLATCHGPVPGFKPSSFRAEAYGMLSNAILYNELRSKGIRVKATFICDNEGVIKVLTRAIKDARIHIDRNQNDDDLIRSNAMLLHPFKDDISLEWIKGHQDRIKKWDDLCIKAKLNVAADSQAELGHALATKIDVPEIIPLGQTRLIIDAKGVTNHMRRHILDSSSREKLRSYIISKSKMTEEAFETINWAPMKPSLQAFSHAQRSTLVKYMHNQLALGVRIEHRKKGEPHSCQSCLNGTIETDWHFLRCPSRRKWRSQTQRALREKLEHLDTSPQLTATVLNAFFSGLDPDFIRDRHGDRKIEDILPDDQLWKGRIPSVWTDRYEQEKPNDQEHTGTSWGKGIVLCIFHAILHAWVQRNVDRHGATEEAMAAIDREKTLQQVRDLQGKVTQIRNPKDRKFFFDDKEDFDKRRTITLKSYLGWAVPLAKQCLQDQGTSFNDTPPPRPPPAPNVVPNREGTSVPQFTFLCTQGTQSTVTECSPAAHPGLPNTAST